MFLWEVLLIGIGRVEFSICEILVDFWSFVLLFLIKDLSLFLVFCKKLDLKDVEYWGELDVDFGIIIWCVVILIFIGM